MSKVPTSSTKKKNVDDTNYEHEQQFVLRMPPEAAETLREEVITGSPTLTHNISIEMLPDMKRALIRYGHYIYNAKMVDLPCIIESLKTIDRKTLYKTADICQMLVCTEDDVDMEDVENLKKKEREKKYTWNHGVTPPLKNVRRRRFRKTLTKKYNEQPDIEKEVRQLFRMDSEAIDVKWEVIAEESAQGTSPSHEMSESIEAGDGEVLQNARVVASGSGIAHIDLFGELSSSEEDEKNDSGGEEESQRSGQGSQGGEGSRVEVPAEEVPSGPSRHDREMIAMKIENIKAELEDLRAQRMEQEIQMATMDNPALKHHFQEMMDKLTEEEIEKEVQYQMLMTMAENG